MIVMQTVWAAKGFSHASLAFTSRLFRRSSRRTVTLFPTGIQDVWRSFILAAAKIFHIFCGIHHPYLALMYPVRFN